MAFIVKGEIYKVEVQPPPAEIKKERFDIKIPNRPVINVTVVEKYKHVQDGDLHRMINKKSGYLRDMIGADNK